MINTVNQNTVKFSNDLFFKYMLSSTHPLSLSILKKLIEVVSGITCQKLEVLNPNISAATVNQKSIVLDIHARDENNNEIDIEMQMYGSEAGENKRFQYYGAKLLTEQLERGKEYYQLSRVMQLILINRKGENLIDEYISRNQDNKREKEYLNIRYYVNMRKIEEILKEKGRGELNEIERISYLFIRNRYDDIIKEDKEDIIRQVVKMYDRFKRNEEMWELGKQRELALIRERSFKHEYHDLGFKQGLAKGILKEKRAKCNKIIEKVYHEEALSWIEGLNANQLDKLFELAFETDDFMMLKKKVEN